MTHPAELTQLTAPDGHRIAVHTWTHLTPEPRGILHICHGMAEHGGRYRELAFSLARSGWIVVAHDHRGHGNVALNPTGTPGGPIAGHYADQDGWQRVTEDVGQVQRELRATYRDLPIVLMGHSMGALIAQGYLVAGPAFWPEAVVLSGAARDPRLKLMALHKVAVFEAWRRGPRQSSKLINAMTFQTFSKSVKNRATAFDWLSHDSAEVQRYIDDPLCGFDCTTGLWRDLARGLLQITAPASFKDWPNELPLYIFAGDRDPVGAFGKGPEALARALSNAGQTQVSLRIYPQMRHEPLHEQGRERVMDDLKDWLNRRIATASARKAS